MKFVSSYRIIFFHHKLTIACLMALFCFAVALPAQAASYYVDSNDSGSSDTNSGSQSSPWKTIQKAANVATSGDTVYVRSATYNESVTIKNSGKSGSPIVFKAYPGDNPIIDGSGSSAIKLVDSPANSYITWDGIDVRNAKGYGIWFEGSYNKIINCKIYNNGVGNSRTGLTIIAGDHNIIRHNEIYNNGWNGLSIPDNNYTTIEFNDIHDHAYHMGVNMFPIQNTGGNMLTGNKVRYNKIHDNSGAGIYTRYQQDFEFVGNLIYRNQYSGIKFTYESGYSSTYTCNGKIYNNTIANNGEDGIRSQSGKSLTVWNNIIYGSGNYDINIYSAVASGHSFDYNLLYNPSFNSKWGVTSCSSISSWQSASGQDAHSINKDPLFNNASGNDYTLQSNSPAIDSGFDLGSAFDECVDPSSSWPNNVILILQDSDWDMGAFIMTPWDQTVTLFAPENLRIVSSN